MPSADPIAITLSKEEALVLFEFLSRCSRTEKLELGHPAEERALWGLECALEKVLVEPFAADYQDILVAARARLVDET